MSKARLSLKLIAVCGLVVLDFLGACAAAHRYYPLNPTELYLEREGRARATSVATAEPTAEWIVSPKNFLNHDWSLNIGDVAFGLVQWQNLSWSVLIGRGSYMVHFTSPGFVLFTAVLIAVGVIMFRWRKA